MGKHRPEFPDLEPQGVKTDWGQLLGDVIGVIAFFATIWCLLLFATAL